MGFAFRFRRLERRKQRSAQGPVTLTQSRIYILPTRAGVLFGVTVLVMLFGCINYNLGLGYLLTFLMSGVGIASILHTFRNLARLQLKPGRPDPVFAGGEALFPVLVANPDAITRRSIGMTGAGREPVFVDVGPGQTATVHIGMPTAQRGRLRLEGLRALTTFPLGLFHAWSTVDLDMHCLVYPRPEPGRVSLPGPRAGNAEGLETGQGQNDFAGLRKYQAGDSLRHVAWKALARGQPVMTKQFSGLAAGELWLEWDDLPTSLRLEERLSRLTRWVLEAARAGHPYGLRLPSLVIPPGAGQAHDQQCLTALALFEP
ncbi:MAG TPA: DUF58 domain-containing protein [Burkholderiales bacterium]|nr:DUF58 domain-containing protein [Burkholderiales bacterium]